MESSDRQHRVEVLPVHKVALQLAALVEHLHRPGPRRADHKAVFPLGVPHRRQLGQFGRPGRVCVVSEDEEGCGSGREPQTDTETHRNNKVGKRITGIHLMDVSRGDFSVIEDVSYILSVEDRIELQLKGQLQ